MQVSRASRVAASVTSQTKPLAVGDQFVGRATVQVGRCDGLSFVLPQKLNVVWGPNGLNNANTNTLKAGEGWDNDTALTAGANVIRAFTIAKIEATEGGVIVTVNNASKSKV